MSEMEFYIFDSQYFACYSHINKSLTQSHKWILDINVPAHRISPTHLTYLSQDV
jgi:hypothetical protein